MANIAPAVMPGRNHHTAPKFDGTPTLLSQFFDEVEQLAETCQLSEQQKIDWTIRYAPVEDAELWRLCTSAKRGDWGSFKAEIYALYPGSTGDRKYSVANLEMLTEKQAASPMETSVQFGKYYRSFCKIAHFLKEKERLTDREISAHFLQGFDFAFRNKVRAQLRAENPTHHTDDPFKLDQISSAALFVLSCNKGDIVSAPKEDSMVVKREHFDISDLRQFADPMANKFNITVLAQEIAKIMSMNMQQGSSAGPQYSNIGTATTTYQPQGNTNGQGQYQQARPRSNTCLFCGDVGHFINSCAVAMDYVRNGKCMRNLEGQIILPNGERVNPRLHFGLNIKERIDNWHSMNAQAKVSTNLVSISGEGDNDATSELEPTKSQFVWIEVQDEEEEEGTTLEGDLEDLHLMESLLNSTQKKVDDARRKLGQSKGGPVTRSAAQRQTVKGSKDDINRKPVVAQPTMAANDLAKNPTSMSIPMAPKEPAGTEPHVPQFRYVTPVENTAILERVTRTAMDTSMQLTVRELLAVAPDIRKAIKEQVSTKRVMNSDHGLLRTNMVEEQSKATVHTLMATLPGRSDGLVVSNHSEKLRAIDVILNGSTTVEAILDEGSQIIGLNKNMWEKLGLAVRADHLVRMESANSSQNTSMGLLQDLKLTICGYNFYLQVQVIEDAAYEMLLGLPFHVLTRLESKFFEDGSSHITLTDPNTGAVIKLPTRERNKQECNAGTHMLTGF